MGLADSAWRDCARFRLWRRSAPVACWRLPSAVGLVGVMQFQWPHLAPRETCCRLTIVTLNGNQVARPGAFSRLVEDSGADIVAMQEWDQETAGAMPAGWRVHCEKELCVAARHPIQRIDVMYSGTGDARRGAGHRRRDRHRRRSSVVLQHSSRYRAQGHRADAARRHWRHRASSRRILRSGIESLAPPRPGFESA